jgi:hypothetical protein
LPATSADQRLNLDLALRSRFSQPPILVFSLLRAARAGVTQ